MKILLTGCAGFIGSHVLDQLVAEGHEVVGVDNFDTFYDRSIKEQNLGSHYFGKGSTTNQVKIVEADLAESRSYAAIEEALHGCMPDAIIHLAAKAGVRPSLKDPMGFQRANVIATQNLFEFAKNNGINHVVFASSSSVYGINSDVPWSEADAVLKPISPYASTKVSCELMGHVYSHLYGMRVIALRFFTVYGPRQRPDLAINKFVRLIEAGEAIPVFGDGSTRRDYTYVHDIVDGIMAALIYNKSNYEIINLGNNHTISLSEMIETIELVVGKKAIIDRQPQQPGDVPQTWADITRAQELLGYMPQTTFEEGIRSFYGYASKLRENAST